MVAPLPHLLHQSVPQLPYLTVGSTVSSHVIRDTTSDNVRSRRADTADPLARWPSVYCHRCRFGRRRHRYIGNPAEHLRRSSLTTRPGNGRASSILLAEVGAHVACIDVNEADARRTVEMIQAEGKGKALALVADITDQDACRRAVQTVLDAWGRVDVLVNIVGTIGAAGTAVDVDMAAWAAGMQLNVASMVHMAKHCIPAMERNTDNGLWRGAIVNLASVAGLRGGTPSLLYPTSKGAVVNMTRAMAAQHAPQGIRVNCVCPGMLFTPMMYGKGMTEEKRAARRDRSLLKTEGNGWDCAAAVRFLASDEARWMTGVILPVDAGTTASTSFSM